MQNTHTQSMTPAQSPLKPTPRVPSVNFPHQPYHWAPQPLPLHQDLVAFYNLALARQLAVNY